MRLPSRRGPSDTSSATSADSTMWPTPVITASVPTTREARNYQASSDTAVAECFDVVPPAPTITNFTPTSGRPGATVIINGTNLSEATKVTIGSVSATIKSDTGSRIKVKVPVGAHTGKIKIVTAGGTVKSATKFTVT